MCCSISDNAWLQATLPFSLGALGLRKSQHSSHPGSCNSAQILVSCLVPNFDVTSSFPREKTAMSYFKDLSISFSHLSSQNDLQASLDNQLFPNVFSSSTRPSLSLAFSPHDFVIALRLWLGVPLFPLCTCLSVIDQLVTISLAPLRIQCHDALVNIVHHALLQDHPGSKVLLLISLTLETFITLTLL